MGFFVLSFAVLVVVLVLDRPESLKIDRLLREARNSENTLLSSIERLLLVPFEYEQEYEQEQELRRSRKLGGGPRSEPP